MSEKDDKRKGTTISYKSMIASKPLNSFFGHDEEEEEDSEGK